MTTHTEPIGLVLEDQAGAHLAGGRCPACGVETFPRAAACPRCSGPMLDIALPDSGTVWTMTVQRLEPKPPYRGPSPFVPFAVAYVDLGPVRVEAPLSGRPADEWRIGDPVEFAPGEPDADGNVWTFSFRPKAGA